MQQNILNDYQPFIKDVFHSLEREKIPYVVLRNYDNLPVEPGQDIDLLVVSKFLKTAGNILKTSAEKNGWILIQEMKRYGYLGYIFISGTDSHHKLHLKWEMSDPICWMGFTWMDTNLVIDTRTYCERGFYIPNSGVEAAILLIKDLLQAGTIRRKYCARIHYLTKMELNLFIKALSPAFGKDLSTSIQFLVEKEDWDEIERNFLNIRRTLIKRSIEKQPVRTFLHLIQFFYGPLYGFIRGKYSLLICFIGPDGSGKTTVSTRVLESMKDIFDEKKYYHGYYEILPPISRFIPSHFRRENNANTTEDLDPISMGTDNKKKQVAMHTAIMAYYSCDYILGSLRNKLNRRKSKLIIFDRYFYDFIIQKRNLTPECWSYRFLSFFVPKPDLIVYLRSPVEVIYSRKQELTPEEISRQNEVCDYIIQHNSNVLDIDNTIELDLVIQKVHESALKLLANK